MSALHLVDQDSVAVDFHNYHDVLVSSEQSLQKLPNLFGEDSFTDVVDFCVDVLYFLFLKLQFVGLFECAWGSNRAGLAGTSFLSQDWLAASIACGRGRRLGGTHVLSRLVQVTF